MEASLEAALKRVIADLLDNCAEDLSILGADIGYLRRIASLDFRRLEYKKAQSLLRDVRDEADVSHGLSDREIKHLLSTTYNIPTFIERMPHSPRVFTGKTDEKGRSFRSVLLMPKVGYGAGVGVREEDLLTLKSRLIEAAKFFKKAKDPLEVSGPLKSYLSTISQYAPIAHGGYWIHFERLIGLLLGSRIF